LCVRRSCQHRRQSDLRSRPDLLHEACFFSPCRHRVQSRGCVGTLHLRVDERVDHRIDQCRHSFAMSLSAGALHGIGGMIQMPLKHPTGGML